MKLTTEQKLAQRLSPQTLQYIQLLQMTAVELSSHLENLVQENPVVELGTPPPGEDWARMKWLGRSPRPQPVRGEDDDRSDAADYHAGRFAGGESLDDHVRLQLIGSGASEACVGDALALAACLDGRGYLDGESFEHLASLIGSARAKSALALLQSASPAGIGARDLCECLLLQLRRLPEDTALAEKIAESYLEQLAASSFQLIAKKLGAPLKSVYAACAQIRGLSPFPGNGFSEKKATDYVVPDVLVDRELNVTLNNAWLPSIQFSDYYIALASSTEDRAVKQYLDEKLNQAKWVVSAIEQRNTTLSRCVRAIVEAQSGFFRGGTKTLQPLRQADISEALGFHDSTISRAIRGKYLHCAFGTFPLEYFFTSSVPARSEPGGSVSSASVKAIIAELIEHEDRAKPLSDEAVAALLSARGIQSSRRTVAKYRAETGIPNTAARRARYFSG